jgi:heavy metal translocating P-type ATPase
LVEHSLMQREGVIDAHVDFLTEIGTITLDLRQSSRESALAGLERLGYRAQSLDDEIDSDPERLFFRTGVAAIAAMNTMMLAFVHYAEILGISAGSWKTMIGGLGAVLAIPAVAYCGAPIFRRALGLARQGQLAMETLLVLGIVASLGLSLLAFVLPGADFYFEIPTMIVTTALASRLADRAIRRRGARQVASLLRPRAIRVKLASVPGRASTFADLDDLREGDRIVIPEGGEVPADLEVLGEAVTVSEAVISGEPIPILKRLGATVLAGSEVTEGELIGEVLRPATASAHAQIGRQILEVLRGNQDRTAAADRIAGIFVIAILIVAALTVFGHAWLGGHGLASPAAWLPAIAVLVVACPCAFSLAASASMGAAALRLLREGVLLRDPAALELAADVDVAVFDKTGTLTLGDMDVRALDWAGEPLPELLAVVAGLEARSRHPMAAAIRRYLASREVGPALCLEVEEVRGRGIIGLLEGRRVAVGTPELFDEIGDLANPEGDPRPYVLFGPVEAPAGRLVFEDRVRPSARGALDELRTLGVEVRILSGDDRAVVRRCAEDLGIERSEGRALPRVKAERVEALRSEGRVVMYVGDGVNDAPALAAASVGIAMRHGASMALETAGLLAVRDDPAAAGQIVRFSRRLRWITRENYLWALIYNVVLVPVGALGLLHPAWAALAMLLSSVTVLANSARLLRW